VFLIVF